MKEKVLITGVAGFIGSHVASRMVLEGYDVVGVDDLSVGRVENVPTAIDFIQGDLALTSTISKLPTDCKKILHLAGQSSGEISFDDPISDLQKNTVSTLNLIKFGADNRTERFVYASSMSVYGNVEGMPTSERSACLPLSCYGVSKLAGEHYLRIFESRLPSVRLRMFNVYGPGQDMENFRQGMVSIFVAQALKNAEIEVRGSLERYRDLIYIDDVVEAWVRAAKYNSALNQTINVGAGVRTQVQTLLDSICSIIPNISYHTSLGTPGDQFGIYADTSNLAQLLDMHSFTPLREGLGKFIESLTTSSNDSGVIRND